MQPADYYLLFMLRSSKTRKVLINCINSPQIPVKASNYLTSEDVRTNNLKIEKILRLFEIFNHINPHSEICWMIEHRINSLWLKTTQHCLVMSTVCVTQCFLAVKRCHHGIAGWKCSHIRPNHQYCHRGYSPWLDLVLLNQSETQPSVLFTSLCNTGVLLSHLLPFLYHFSSLPQLHLSVEVWRIMGIPSAEHPLVVPYSCSF